MGGALLMLDDLKAPIQHLSEALNREIIWAETVREAAGQLESNPERYAALLVEPFLYSYRLGKISELQGLMVSARDDRHLPVVVLTTERRDIGEIYHLEEGVHYDVIVHKWGRSSPVKDLMRTLDELLPQ
jgi:hypothetical protein